MGRYLELASAALVQRWARRAAAVLATVEDPDRRADLRHYFEERAGILEFDFNNSRDDAEMHAFRQLVSLMDREADPDDLGK